MALVVKPEPFTREIDRVFDAFFGQTEQGRRWVPPIDLVEAEDHFVLKADLPGLREGDVNIEVQDGTLTISGERKAEHEQRERGWYRIEAAFDHGVLEVRIPKPEERKPRRIEISSTTGNGKPAAVEGSAKET